VLGLLDPETLDRELGIYLDQLRSEHGA